MMYIVKLIYPRKFILESREVWEWDNCFYESVYTQFHIDDNIKSWLSYEGMSEISINIEWDDDSQREYISSNIKKIVNICNKELEELNEKFKSDYIANIPMANFVFLNSTYYVDIKDKNFDTKPIQVPLITDIDEFRESILDV